MKAFLRSTWLRWLFKKARAVMGTGVPALTVLSQMGCPQDKLVNFPYYIDVDTYRVRNWDRIGKDIVFLSSGRLHQDKGHDLALKALAAIHSHGYQEFVYRIAGMGPEAERLAHLTRQLGITDHVEFLGWVEPDDMLKLYAEADVLLHPSRFEPYGVAVLEAMASGIVVIASDATMAALDRIIPGENGFIHRSEDISDLISQIQQVIAHSEEFPHIGQKARCTTLEWPLSRAVATVRELLQNNYQQPQ